MATDKNFSKNSGGGGNYISNMYSVERLVKNQTQAALDNAYQVKHNLKGAANLAEGNPFGTSRQR